MANYLVQISYTPETWAVLIKKPQNRAEAVRKSIETLGGKIVGIWFAFGDHDLVAILEMPDNVSAAAWAIAIAGGGACESVKTTPLMAVEEGIQALAKAATCGYKPAK